MSVHATSWVLKNSSTKLGDRLVLISIADHADADGKDSRPSAIIIARDTRMSVRQVRRCLAKLAKEGRIVCTGTTPSGTKIWDINYDCPLDKNDVSYSGQIVRGDKLSGVTFKASGGVTNRVSRGDKSGIPYNKVEPSGTINNNRIVEKPKREAFKRPTLAEIEAYCKERGNIPISEAQAFLDYRETTGWVYGKNRTPIKDWQAAFRTWEGNYKKFNQTATRPVNAKTADQIKAENDEWRGVLKVSHE